jgi:hypothetical protein
MDASPTAPFRPDFLVIGAMKAATSTVCAYFEDHPDTFMVPRAEPNFFSHDDNWAKGPAWYASHFAARQGERLCGEGSNDYASADRFPHTVERMAATCPEVRLIYMVRHPLDRIASAWVQLRASGRRGVTPPTLDEAVSRKPEVFLDQSLYWKQLSRYREHFPDDRIFVGFMEDMQADQPAFFARLCAFLGLEPAPTIKRQHANVSAGKPLPSPLYDRLRGLPGLTRAANALIPAQAKEWVVQRVLSRPLEAKPAFSPAVRARLLEVIRPDAAALLAHCGKPADHWKLG